MLVSQQWTLLGQTARRCLVSLSGTLTLGAFSPFFSFVFGLYAWEGLEGMGVGLMS